MKDSSNSVQILIFEMKNREKNTTQNFGLNIFKIQEIITCPQVTHMINTDPAILGLIKSRDELIPLVDLSHILFGSIAETKKEPLVIICHGSERKLALLVDNVSTITNSTWEEVKSLDTLTTENNYINGFINVENELISLLNLEEIMIKYLGINGRENKIKSDKIKGKNILVIDDSKWVHKVINAELEIHGVNYSEALNGKAGLDKVQHTDNQYDLILCDIEMPVMNGYTFLEELNKSKNSGVKIPPVIMYSSLCDDVSIEKAKKLGAVHYITKYNMEKIVKTIEQFS